MSRWVDKPHGLTLSSGNYFFVTDQYHEEGVTNIRDGYNALVSFRKYTFDQCSTANVWIETPAEQLIWRRKRREEGRSFKDITYTHYETYYVLSELAVRWLNDNVGTLHDKWDTYTQAQMSSRSVFFKRRKDALAFCNMINSVLAGVKIGEW